MGTRVDRGRAKVRQRAGRRPSPVARASLVARRDARAAQYPAPGVRPQLSSFVARCLRSWAAARASATEFLATWTPLTLPEPGAVRTRAHRARRSAARSSARSGRRAALHPVAFASAPLWEIPLSVAGSAEALRARYPLVSALLVEMAAQRRRGGTAPRRQQRV